MKLVIDIETVTSFPDNDETIARVFYPDEGSRIYITKGLSKTYVEDSIFHEIGHVIDWYLSEGKQAEDTGIREKLADEIGDGLHKCFNGEARRKMEFFQQLTIDGDTSLSELLHQAYSRGWCDGYKEKGVEFDWIDEGFAAFVAERFQKEKEKEKEKEA